MYWDGERQTYLLEPSQSGTSNAAGTTEEDGESGNMEKKGKKKEKEVKVAKQIAKVCVKQQDKSLKYAIEFNLHVYGLHFS